MPDAFLSVFDYPGPVVAAINGHAIAGGCVVAMAADVRLMSGGLIGLTEVAVGVPFPLAALEICRYAMGTSVTGAMLRAENIDARTALERGWIDEVVAPDEPPAACDRDRTGTRAAFAVRLRGDEGPTPRARTSRDRRRGADRPAGARRAGSRMRRSPASRPS